MRTVPKTLAETFREILSSQAVDMHTALPGIVESYDHNTQTASVRPGTKRVIPVADDTDDEETEELPIIQGVRVCWPGGGGFFIHCPLEAGDTVLLVFPETDINAWAETGDVADPSTPERFTLSGAIAIPMLRHKGNPIEDTSATQLSLGKDGTSTKIAISDSTIFAGGSRDVAFASDVNAELTKIKTTLDSLTGGSGSPATFATPYTKGTLSSNVLKGD